MQVGIFEHAAPVCLSHTGKRWLEAWGTVSLTRRFLGLPGTQY